MKKPRIIFEPQAWDHHLAEIEHQLAQARRETAEECAKMAVRRMTAWTKDDDRKSILFREGIEQACSDLAVAIRARFGNDTIITNTKEKV